MTCQQVREGLREYLDDAAPPGTADLTRDHLNACAACSTYLWEMQRTRDLLSALPRASMPPGMKAALLEALRQRPPA